MSPILRRLGALGVNDRGTRARLSPSRLADRDHKVPRGCAPTCRPNPKAARAHAKAETIKRENAARTAAS